MTEGSLMLGFVYLAVPNTTGQPLNSSQKYLHIFEALENKKREEGIRAPYKLSDKIICTEIFH